MGEYEKELIESLKNQRDFSQYLNILAQVKQYCVIFSAVGDTGTSQYFNELSLGSKFMDALGTSVDLTGRYRHPYIAIIDHGDVVYECCSDNIYSPLVTSGSIGKHTFEIYSAGFCYQHGVGMGAHISLDGEDYCCEHSRGINFVIVDCESDQVIDCCAFDVFDMCNCIRENDALAPTLREFIHTKNVKAQIVTIRLPRNNNKWNQDLSPHEKFMRDNPNFWSSKMTNKEIFKDVFEKKLYHFCYEYDSFEDMWESWQVPTSYYDINGKRSFVDYHSRVVNTKSGIRHTTSQPEHYERTIFLIGPCTMYGIGATDENTPASLLQKILNANCHEGKFIVKNYSYVYRNNYFDQMEQLKFIPLKDRDIVFFYSANGFKTLNLPCCDLQLESARPHDYGEIFTYTDHYSANGNRMIADNIFKFLKKYNFFSDGSIYPTDWLKDTDEIDKLVAYKYKLHQIYVDTIRPKVGSIVMNANPFTLGHRYLVEQALKQCDHLIVFVVEEDKSEFSFADRFELVRTNLADLNNVTIIPSGEFIISSTTFSDYFNKAKLQDVKVDTSRDIIMFAKEIAPCLGISVRFAGQEPFDTVTAQYNEDMSQILPQYGIEFIEIPRLQTAEGEVVNATKVRTLLKNNELEKCRSYLTQETYDYIQREVGVQNIWR